MTQEALARAAGLGTSAVSKLEQKGVDPSWSTALRLAKALGVNTTAFEGVGEGSVPTDLPPAQEKPKRRKPRPKHG